MADIDRFRTWLRGQGYREATVKAYGKAVGKALKNKDPTTLLRKGNLPRGHRTIIGAALKRWAEFIGGGAGEELLKGLRSLPRSKSPQTPPERPLTDVEWRRLEVAVEEENEPLRAILGLLVTTGLRVGADIGRIEREKVEEALETGVLYMMTKGGHYRAYPAKAITDRLKALLELKGWKFIWQSVAKSESAYYMAAHRALRRCAVKAKLDPKKVHPHLLRKTTATQLLRATGGNIVAVQKMLGHRDIKTTQGYVAYVDPEELEGYVDILKKAREEKR